MGRRLDMIPTSRDGRGGPFAVQHVIRMVTILVVIVGVALLGVRYYRQLFGGGRGAAGSPAAEGTAPRRIVDKATGEVDIIIDTRTQRTTVTADNATRSSLPVPDNAAEVEAIVGLNEIRDGALIEPQPLYYLLREVELRRPADDFYMKRAPETSVEEFRLHPDKYRAQPVTVRGQIDHLERSRLPENPSGIRDVLEGYLIVGREGICMFITSRVTPVRTGQVVDIHGLFVKLVSYQSRGRRLENAPLVIASHLVPVQAAATTEKEFPINTVMGILAGLFVIYFLMMFMLRRKQAASNPRLEALRKMGRFSLDRSEEEGRDEEQEQEQEQEEEEQQGR